jgi:hypothetical protein
MKKRIITEGKEALERTLLMMNYDMKKTLTENVEVISEQENVGGNPEDLQIAIKLRKATTDILGTDESGLEEALNSIKDKAQYDRVNALMPKYSKYKSIQDALNNEFETDNLDEVIKLKDILSKKGVNLTYKTYVDLNSGDTKYKYKSIAISAGASPTPSVTATDTTTKDPEAVKQFTSFSCVPNHPRANQSKMSNGSFAFNIDGEFYYNNGRKKTKDGKMVSYTCNDTIFKTSGGKKSVPSVTDKNIISKLDFSYKFPGDEKYVYAYSSPENALKEQVAQAGKWYGKNIATGKVFDITTNYPTTAAKLNDNFFTSGKAEPTTQTASDKAEPTTQTASAEQPKKITDMSSIELSIMKKQEPLKYNSEYGKLGAIEKKMVDDKMKGSQTTTEQPMSTKKITDMSSIEISNMKKQEPLKYNSEYSKLGAIEKKKVDDKMKGVQTESLKKSLKKNLIEAKEKQEDLMVENKIITNRFNFLFEGRSFETEEEKDYLVESVITEIGYLKIQGYSSRAINEGLFSMLGNIFGGSVKSIPAVFGEYIAGWLTKTLGIPQNSYMGSVVVALVGNLNIADYDKFFSDCRFASNKIADSLIEGYVLQLQNEKNLNTGASGFIVSALRNSVVDYFTEDKSSLIQILEDKIGEFLCPKLSKLSSAISDKTDDLKSKIVA